MTKKYRQDLIDSMLKGVADFVKTRFDAEPEIQCFSCTTCELCDTLLSAGIGCRMFTDDNIDRIFTNYGGYRREGGQWIFHRQTST